MRSAIRHVTLLALGAGLCLAAPPAQAASPPPPSAVEIPQHTGPAGVRTVRHPLIAEVRGHDAAGRPLLAAGAPGGYTAAQLRAATGLQGTGRGQTVAIVDAFDDPYLEQELNAYSEQMGLTGICKGKHTRNCFQFTKIEPFGVAGIDTGWALETALDAEMVHALAPEAAITMVEAHDNSDEAMFAAVDYAATLHPAVISNSWGADEDPTETRHDGSCALADGVCTAATGDAGHPGGYPAYNPHVLAIGGTTLSLDRSGNVLGETAWQGSGGGLSQFEPRPAYQPEALTARGNPDVSFDAAPATGVATYSELNGGWFQVGGTSVGAPAWAAILADADQLRAEAGKGPLTAANDQAQRAVYGLTSGLADITSGTNGACGADCTAGPGYDLVTGLGSPRAGIDTALAAAPDTTGETR